MTSNFISSTSLPSSSSSSSQYDVFLSFKGEDTRYGFTSHLYQALHDKGVHTFMDEPRLTIGEKIADSLWRAIEHSLVCIVVLSSGYADSKWCLMELTKMLESKKKIIPIFYHVDPSAVRHLSISTFEAAFRDHEQRFDPQVVAEWKKALREVGQLKGFSVDAHGREAQWVQVIVKTVLHEFINPNTSLDVNDYLVGIEPREVKVMKLLDIEVQNVKIIAICGMGGIGKTTLAKVIYNKISQKFDSSSFIANIREAASQPNGLVMLQKQLIAQLVNDNSSEIHNIHQGTAMVKRRCQNKKVLIVLDDIDHRNQLAAFVGKKPTSTTRDGQLINRMVTHQENGWFGDGSRVIVTTRDKQILQNIKIHDLEIYDIDELNKEESLELFSYHAFGRREPMKDYIEISEKMVAVTGGLPLALEVIGSNLFDEKDVQLWHEMLEKLKRVPHEDVQKRLRISYDALASEDRSTFLDIAFFFQLENREHVIDILRGFGLSSMLDIKVFQHKSLIKVDELDRIVMHDQLRDTARNIVEEESKDPGKRSRLTNGKDVWNVLNYHKGTEHIEGIAVIGDFMKKVAGDSFEAISTEAFTNMGNLRWLHINNVKLEGNFSRMPTNLKSLKWHWFPLHSLPMEFNLNRIGFLDLSDSHIVELWRREQLPKTKVFNELRILNLTRCQKLVSTPEFTCLPNLEKLNVWGCMKLATLDDSIGFLKELIELDMSFCMSLERLPDSIGNMKSLRRLYLMSTAITELPHSIGLLQNLEILNANGCLKFSWLPDSIGCLTELKELDFGGCFFLRALPASVCNLKNLTKLKISSIFVEQPPGWIWSLKKLKALGMTWNKEPEYTDESEDVLENLEELNLRGQSSPVVLISFVNNLQNLSKLEISSQEIEELPYQIGSLHNLKTLPIYFCTKIRHLPDSIGGLTKLQELSLFGCKIITALPNEIGNMRCLSKLVLDRTAIEEIQYTIVSLDNLKILSIIWCSKLRGPLPLWGMKRLEILLVGDEISEEPNEERENLEGCLKLTDNTIEMSAKSTSTQEERRILLLREGGTILAPLKGWELSMSAGSKERVIYVTETDMHGSKKWLRLIFPDDFVCEMVRTKASVAERKWSFSSLTNNVMRGVYAFQFLCSRCSCD